MVRNSPKIIDLFSGAGGLSLGFQLAGFEVILGVDNFQSALESFKLNHDHSETELFDLSKSIPHHVKQWLHREDLFGIVGGPPCQGFSDAKGTRSVLDERNKLVFQYIQWVKEFKPSFFIMENVTGITTIQKGEFFEHVKAIFRDLGYRVAGRILHAAEFGVPQKRERMFLIGVLTEYDVPSNKLHPRPMYYIPSAMKGLTGKNTSQGFASSLDTWLNENEQGVILLGENEKPLPLKKFVSVKNAFEGLPEHVTINGEVDLPETYVSEYMKFIRKEGSISHTTLHIAKNVKKRDLEIVSKIPEGKIYRSNRFGERYIAVWDIFKEKFTSEELLALQFIGRAQTKKKMIIEKNKNEGHVELGIIINETGLLQSTLDHLVEKQWLRKIELSGKVGYRLSTKAGLRPRFMRLHRDSISHTILTVDFDGREKIHPTQNRGISLREGARLQSFPDDFHFVGNFNHVTKQIGNAVPPLLAYHVARNLINVMHIKLKPKILFP